jgi:dUTP pyrophosphatase
MFAINIDTFQRFLNKMFRYVAGVVCAVIASSAILYKLYRRREFKIQYVKFDDRAIIPKRATDGSVGYDIFTFEDVEVPANSTAKIATGLGIKLPDGYFPEMHGRSSLSIKNTAILAGIIDEDYWMQIYCIFANLGSEPVMLKAGMAIAQFKIHKAERIDGYVVVKEIQKTTRTGGFGSTDKKNVVSDNVVELLENCPKGFLNE